MEPAKMISYLIHVVKMKLIVRVPHIFMAHI